MAHKVQLHIKSLFLHIVTFDLLSQIHLHLNPMTTLNRKGLNNHLRNASFRRNLRTAALLGAAASGGIFGVSWLAASCSSTFITLLIIRAMQLRPVHNIVERNSVHMKYPN